MSEMVERVAKALAGLSDMDSEWQLFSDQARAAIEAMREPTKAMVEVGDIELPVSSYVVWQDMIDAALQS